MRNPIRLKNASARYAPYYLLGLAVLVLHRPSAGALGVGLLPILAGLAIRTWGAGHLVKNDALTLTGPYAHVRHPLYLGTILIATGFAIVLGGWLTALALAGVLPWFFGHYFPRKERGEGDRLEALYGDAYAAYRRAVPALVPRLHAWRPAREAGAEPAEPPAWSAASYDENNELGTLLAVCAGVAAFTLRAFWPAA